MLRLLRLIAVLTVIPLLESRAVNLTHILRL